MAHLVVVGLGMTGEAVVRRARAGGDRVTVLEDTRRDDREYRARVAAARALGAEVLEEPVLATVAEIAAGADVLVPSPGVPARHAAIAAARAAGVPVRAEIDLAAAAARDTPIVAVTGTNGKTTVTTLVTAMLAASGLDARAAGNIGAALLDAAGEQHDVLVAEVSSFQLTFTTVAFRPRVAVLLNLADDHLDWHGSQAAYAAAKAHVFVHQRAEDLLVFNADDEQVAALAATAPGRTVGFSVRSGPPPPGYGIAGGGLVAPDGREIARTTDVQGGAPHSLANALAAAAAALEVGATSDGVRSALRGFEGLPHRLQLVGEGGGVRYYDDSKATNPHATVAAVAGVGVPTVLLAGGRNKGLDLSVLRTLAPHLRAVVAIGEAAPEIEAAFADAAPVMIAADMRAAVDRATELARSGDAVILSPACASFDRYPSYAARGDDFAAEVARVVDRNATSAAHTGVSE